MALRLPLLLPVHARRWATALLSSPFLLLAQCAPAPASHDAPAETALIRLADDEVKGTDPQLYSDLATLRVAAEQFEGLTRFNGAGRVEAGLAESWSAASDGRSWTFQLRPGLAFSDGTPIEAALFARVFARLRAKETASPIADLFQIIESVAAAPGNRVIVRLNAPFPALPELFAHPALAAMPLHRPDWTRERPMTASGAYQLTRWQLNDSIRLDANPRWHQGRPAIPTVFWKPVSDSLTALRSFQAGQADIIGEFPSSRLAELRRTAAEALHVSPYRGTYYFAFNTRRPPFDDRRVRRALSMVVDRGWLAHQLIATGVAPATRLVPPVVASGAAPAADWESETKAQRLRIAKSLLAQAGYGPERPLAFDIRFNSDVDHRRAAVALAAFWRPLGVEARLLNTEASLHFASLRRGDFALARSGWLGDISAPENFLSIHRSTAGAINYAGYASAEFDAALAAALQLSDPAARAAAMAKAETILLNDAPVLPLWHYVSKSMVSKRVGGWQDNPANVHPTRTLWLRTS